VFNVYDVAQSVVESLSAKAAEKNVTVNVTGEPINIKANSRLIDEMIYNLVDNGIKYNTDGGSVTVNVQDENGRCKISVIDTGIGIEAAHQQRVFERFYRVDSSRSKKTGGTGLGLSIVKHIVDHHNGTIRLESTEGIGTKIEFSLPK
jgi:two-component system phosphate regulon sensor histidine kinase PhoR